MFFRRRKARKPDQRPTATEDCRDCLAPAGGKHEWSCEQVTPEQFAAFLGSTASNTPPA